MGEMVPTLIQKKDDDESVAYYDYAAQQKRRKHTTSYSFKMDLENSDPDKFKQIFSLVPVTPSFDQTITMASRGDFAHVPFHNSDLRNIGFQCSNLNHAILSDAILCGCDFTHADLRHADFSNADIHYACLTGALLDGCNMTGADLRGTELPDGFCSMDQNEQVEHLKSLNIPELII